MAGAGFGRRRGARGHDRERAAGARVGAVERVEAGVVQPVGGEERRRFEAAEGEGDLAAGLGREHVGDEAAERVGVADGDDAALADAIGAGDRVADGRRRGARGRRRGEGDDGYEEVVHRVAVDRARGHPEGQRPLGDRRRQRADPIEEVGLRRGEVAVVGREEAAHEVDDEARREHRGVVVDVLVAEPARDARIGRAGEERLEAVDLGLPGTGGGVVGGALVEGDGHRVGAGAVAEIVEDAAEGLSQLAHELEDPVAFFRSVGRVAGARAGRVGVLVHPDAARRSPKDAVVRVLLGVGEADVPRPRGDG
ncbi:MAG: hypothetical protein R3F65_09300 [bacterium]